MQCIVLAVTAMAVLLVGCGGMGGGSSSGGLLQANGQGFAGFLLVDARTGKVESRDELPDLASNPAYRSDTIVFRRVAGGSPVLGTSTGESYRELEDELRYGACSNAEFFLAVFELTSAQQLRLGQVTDATQLATGTDLPLQDSSAAQIEILLAEVRSRTGLKLRLPSANEWEHACRAGSGALFSWGDTTTDTTANRHAVTTLTGASGPARVGQRQANALGFFDMHGNVWEMTADESPDASRRIICGGSWRDPLLQARSANRVELPTLVPHPLVGVRLALNR